MQEISSDVEDSYFLEESDGEESLDLKVLELEAKRAVREFSDDLSRQLTIEDETANRKEISTKPKKTTKNIPDSQSHNCWMLVNQQSSIFSSCFSS